ncbi:MAG TPA: hypothetical protein VMU22_03205 [Rhizomicrobium sp.]|nr:hypothetical protein [Rhizomicrobium sp.]
MVAPREEGDGAGAVEARRAAGAAGEAATIAADGRLTGGSVRATVGSTRAGVDAAGFASLRRRAIALRKSCSRTTATHAPASDSDTIHSAAIR